MDYSGIKKFTQSHSAGKRQNLGFLIFFCIVYVLIKINEMHKWGSFSELIPKKLSQLG